MTYSTIVSVKPIDAEKRMDSARSICNSPLSISDVGFNSTLGPLESNKVNTASTNNNAKSGDNLEQPKSQDGMRALALGSVDINDAFAHPMSSSQSLKRKAVEDAEEMQDQKIKKIKTEQLTSGETESDYVPTDNEEDEEEHVYKSSTFRDGCGNVELSFDANVECSRELPRRCSRRTLYIEYWSRTGECKERKWDHLDEIAKTYGSAEDHIFATTLKGRTAFLEPNMFPYDTPAGIEHWTLWHVKDLNHEQVAEGLTVLHGRKVENLVHEID
ncbi:unnamed protein product [Peronospora belbahrii]|uniref:Chromo domain-containing protein n=1 Tax=Peronospora belbahrii TaxID=622444 RepID=A0ABN8DBS7_9STRA|nr:unnamed protein product [Peronospora belbahrii]